ncbi:MAG: hypothetical protein IKK53_01720 [Ruminiclostridium sp.]|nr:hypothetical protein [Ruminiclostridium sp.]
MITILQNKDVTDRILFEMKDGDDIYGTVSGTINGEIITISELESQMEMFYDGLVRAILAFADNRFIKTAVFDIDDERKLFRLQKFGFITEESKTLPDIQAFFKEDSCN